MYVCIYIYIYIYNSLVKAYGQACDIKSVLRLWDDMAEQRSQAPPVCQTYIYIYTCIYIYICMYIYIYIYIYIGGYIYIYIYIYRTY